MIPYPKAIAGLTLILLYVSASCDHPMRQTQSVDLGGKALSGASLKNLLSGASLILLSDDKNEEVSEIYRKDGAYIAYPRDLPSGDIEGYYYVKDNAYCIRVREQTCFSVFYLGNGIYYRKRHEIEGSVAKFRVIYGGVPK